jgi:hypothetical protein
MKKIFREVPMQKLEKDFYPFEGIPAPRFTVGIVSPELGVPDDDETMDRTTDTDEDSVEVSEETGRLTPEERMAVMMDLRPSHPKEIF